MGKGLSVVGERLMHHNIFYFERVELRKAAEEHYCCYTLSCLQCVSVHLDQRKQVLTTTGHGITKLPGLALSTDTPMNGLHTLDKTIKALSSLKLVVTHGLEPCVSLDQGVWSLHCGAPAGEGVTLSSHSQQETQPPAWGQQQDSSVTCDRNLTPFPNTRPFNRVWDAGRDKRLLINIRSCSISNSRFPTNSNSRKIWSAA